MRVCVLTAVHRPFDPRIFHRECRTLAQAGHDVTLVAPAEFDRQERDGVTVIGVPRPRRRWQRPLVWARLLRRARRLRPDVVHLHDPELLLLVPLLRLAPGRRPRIVYDVHEYFVDSLADKFWIPPRLRRPAAAVARRLERLLVRGVDGLVLAVEGQRSLYPGFRGPAAAVRNLPLARLFDEADPHPDLAGPGLKLIYVGLILPQRGLDTMIEALARLRAEGVDDVRLFLIGPETSRAYLAKLNGLAAARGLGGQVRWLGYVPPDGLAPYLRAADAGLLPGRHTAQYGRPNLPTKLFEYMLCGLPVLTVDNPHWRAYVEEARCGLVVEAGDDAAHAAAIRWLRDHPAEARAMGERGRAAALGRYAWEQEQDRLLAFYQAVAGRAR